MAAHLAKDSDTVIEAKVVYTTKELLARIDNKFDHIDIRFDRLEESGVVTDAEHTTLSNRVDKLERDAEGTKAVAAALLASGKDRWSRNEKIAGFIFATIALAPSVTSIINLIA